jgi:hypothetical protein
MGAEITLKNGLRATIYRLDCPKIREIIKAGMEGTAGHLQHPWVKRYLNPATLKYRYMAGVIFKRSIIYMVYDEYINAPKLVTMLEQDLQEAARMIHIMIYKGKAYHPFFEGRGKMLLDCVINKVAPEANIVVHP